MRYRHFHRGADTTGDGTGTFDFVGDYSTTGVEALIIPAAGEVISISRLIVHIEDGAGFWAGRYGALAALTTGITVKVFTSAGSTETSNLTPHSIKTNAQWGAMCYDVELKEWGAGDEVLLARYTFERLGKPVILTDDDRIVVALDDDFTGLVHHIFHFQGYYVK